MTSIERLREMLDNLNASRMTTKLPRSGKHAAGHKGARQRRRNQP